MTREITNLVEGVPCWHLQGHFARHIVNAHGDVKEMLLGLIQRHVIPNPGFQRSTAQQVE
jgi:hypothetical protein